MNFEFRIPNLVSPEAFVLHLEPGIWACCAHAVLLELLQVLRTSACGYQRCRLWMEVDFGTAAAGADPVELMLRWKITIFGIFVEDL